MSVIWRYVLVLDDGISPCVDDGVLTLARRKPGVRMRAQREDWVLALAPRSLHPSGVALSFAGRVSANLPLLDYSRRFPDRGDAHPLPDDNMPVGKAGAARRLTQSVHAVANRRALLFEPFWYWGNRQAVSLGQEVLAFADHYSGQKNRNEALQKMAEFETWLRQIAPPGVHGQPADRPGVVRGRLARLRDQ